MVKRILVLFVLLVVGIASTAPADPSVKIVTVDTGFRIDGGSPKGPLSVPVTTDGDATIKFMWLKKDGTVNAGDVKSVYPSGAAGTSAAYPLRAETVQPLPFSFSTAGPDSVYIDVTTTAEVIVAW